MRDNGVGFDQNYAGKLSNAFGRLHRVEKFEGTGIGSANGRRVGVRHVARHVVRHVAQNGVRHGGGTCAEAEPRQGRPLSFSACLLLYGRRKETETMVKPTPLGVFRAVFDGPLPDSPRVMPNG